MLKKENPFYDNHLFTKEDIKRATFNKWQYPLLWFIPMKVQLTSEGRFYYKQLGGKYFLYRLDLN